MAALRILVLIGLACATQQAFASELLRAELGAALRKNPKLSYRSVRRLEPQLGRALDAHVRTLARSNPGLSEAELARLFASDRVLHSFPWTASRVKDLANGVADSPLRGIARKHPKSEDDFAAVGDLVLSTWSKLPEKTTFEERIARVRKVKSGFQWTTLASAAEANPRLQQALRDLLIAKKPPAPPVSVGALTPRRLAEFGPTPSMIERIVARPESTARQAVLERFRAIEREHGNNDGTLGPSDLSRAAPALIRIAAQIYAATGRRSLSLDEIDAQLPAALTKALERRGKQIDEVQEAVTREVLGDLAMGYRTQVLDGTLTSRHFVLERRVQSALWAKWRRAFADVFPEPEAYRAQLTPARLDAVESLYQELLEGKLNIASFYHRAGVSRVQVRLLQLLEPDRFPRAGEGKSVVAHRGSSPPSSLSVDKLTEGWKIDVTEGGMGKIEFARARGINYSAFQQLAQAHPDRFPEPFALRGRIQAEREQKLAALATITEQALAKDVLTTREQLLVLANAAPEFTARWGRLDRTEFDRLWRGRTETFPTMPDAEAISEKLADEIKGLLEERGTLTRVEILRSLVSGHPTMTRSRLTAVLKRHSELELPEWTKESREPDARLVAAWFEVHPGATVVQAADALSRRDPRLTKNRIEKLRSAYPAVFREAGVPIDRLPAGRESLAMAELWRLLTEVAPPGTKIDDLGGAMNRLLWLRNVRPYTSARGAYLAYWRQGKVKSREQRLSELVPLIVEEYARAAPLGATQTEILQRVLTEYPRLTPGDLGKCLRGRKLVGRGETIKEPRYLGGWDLERALFRSDDSEAGLAHATQYVRIPLRLPLLDQVLDDLNGTRPLRDHNVLWVSHLLGTTLPLAMALKQAGLVTHKTVIVGTPYGTNQAARQAIEAEGFDVRVPPLSAEAYREEVKWALDRVIEKHRANRQSIVVLDDGGLVAELLHSDPRYAQVRKHVRIVEQTTRGITVAEEKALDVPIINVARSDVKREEASFIGRAVAGKVLQGLAAFGRKLEGSHATVVGYGAVGAAIAAALQHAGATVTVVEPSSVRAAEARTAGLRVVAKEVAFCEADLVIGATGTRSVSLEDLRLLKDGAFIASASSKQVEIEMESLRKQAAETELIKARSPLVKLPTVRYRLGERRLTVLGDGWPVNFDGDVEDIAPEDIQLTRAAMLAGAIQAAGLRDGKRGIVPFNPATDAKLLASYRRIKSERDGEPPIGDPTAWRDVLRALAKEL